MNGRNSHEGKKRRRDERSRKPADAFSAYAEAYRCGHCNARLQDGPQGWGVYHDPGCPVLAGTIDPGFAGRRAAAAASEATGIPVLHGSWQSAPASARSAPATPGPRGRQVAGRFREQAGHLTVCDHIPREGAINDHGPVYWLAWEPDRIMCLACWVAAEQRAKGTRQDATCDYCGRYIPDPGDDSPRMYAMQAQPGPNAFIQFGLCPDCYDADQADASSQGRR